MPAELVGLVPAAGHATRLGRLPMSKELYPLAAAGSGLPRPVLCWLLEGFAVARVARVLVVLRAGKWDIPAAIGSGAGLGLDVAYRVVEPTPDIPHTIAASASWLGDARVAFGFPDILFRPADSLARVARWQAECGADVLLGLAPTDRPDKADLVTTDARGRLLDIDVKPGPGPRGLTWIHAVWSARFTGFLVDRVARARRAGRRSSRELYPSDLFVAAARAGLEVRARRLPGGRYLDIGTPEDLLRAPRFIAGGHRGRPARARRPSP